jgi:ATP-dependent RNA helicase DDX42
LVPTRELAQQVYSQAKKLAILYTSIKITVLYGGVSKTEQFRSLKGGTDIVIATPGRFIDLVNQKACTLYRCSFLVLDEVDRMLDMGFEGQVRSICEAIRPDRQTLAFSATLRGKPERLIRDFLSDPVRVVISQKGEANPDIEQKVMIFGSFDQKRHWTLAKIRELVSKKQSVLVFCNHKDSVMDLVQFLNQYAISTKGLFGDLSQVERDSVLRGFRKGDFPVLVCTDVASRGLDISSLNYVINYECTKFVYLV